MNADKPISPELQARIDALPDENLRANILRFLSRPWKRTKSNEQIFEEMLADYEEVLAERAKWRQWRDDEVMDFINHFQKEMPDAYVEYLRQERQSSEIDSDLSFKVRKLSMQWMPDLDFHDRTLLLGKVRDHLQAQQHASKEDHP